MKKFLLVLSLVLALFACSDDTSSPTDSKITMNNATANMMINESRAFTVSFDESITEKTVTWSVMPTSGGGSVTVDPNHNNVGIYKAPATAGVYKVYATLVSDPTKECYVEVTVSDAAATCNNIYSIVSPNGMYLYFTSDRVGGVYQIFKANIDGSNIVQLTTTAENKSIPAISRDGSKITYLSGDRWSANAEIYIMNSDGTNQTRLTNNSVNDEYPNFSPNGQQIIFSSMDGSYPEIFRMNIDGSNRTQITNSSGAYHNHSPRYNANGSKIYYLYGFNGDTQIFMMDPDGSNITEITPANQYGYIDMYPAFSPDGTKMVFCTSTNTGNGGRLELYMADADGKNWVKLTTNVENDNYNHVYYHPTDNNKIYFTYNQASGKSSIKSMNINGTNLTELVRCGN